MGEVSGLLTVFFVKQKTAYEMRISDWSSDVCSSDLEKVVRKGADSFLGGTDICFARRKVVKIESFTEPADAAGVKVSRVTYDYELKDVEPWAPGPDFAGAFPQLAALLAKPGNHAPAVMVQTDNGWNHARAHPCPKPCRNTSRTREN